MANSNRLPQHRRPETLEAELEFLSALLAPVEQRLIVEQSSSCAEAALPVIFIMGCPRSGSTLLFQYLAASRTFAYPTNFLSRFYYAPSLGARLQRMLFECDFSGEIYDAADHEAGQFSSRLGKTRGPLAPHEFWYFWRRHFRFGTTQRLTDSEIENANGGQFCSELHSLRSMYDRPFLLKGMILNWNIPYLADLIPGSRFLFIERDHSANAASLLKARVEFFGTTREWYSFRPPGHERVAAESPEVQVAWQVTATNEGVKKGLREIDSDRVIRIRYEEFCAAPQKIMKTINDRWHPLSHDAANLPERFSPSGLSDVQLREWNNHFSRVSELLTGSSPANPHT